jgi:PHD/YefM family antitoxin component YafN of YafNO toxin-antitoxin module
MKTANVLEAKTNFSKLLARVETSREQIVLSTTSIAGYIKAAAYTAYEFTFPPEL